MLFAVKRHLKACPHRPKGRNYTRCNCPLWVDGTIDGLRINRSLDTRDLRTAEDRIRAIELRTEQDEFDKVVTIAEAIPAYLADASARRLRPATLKIYRHVLGLFQSCVGDVRLDTLGDREVRHFREARDVAPSTSRKEIETLKHFFGWCIGREWITKNPAVHVRPPRQDSAGALPFTDDEIGKLFTAISQFGLDHHPHTVSDRMKLRALFLLLLNSGLRISDAANLKRTDVVGNRLIISRQTKTDQPVSVQIPNDLVIQLGFIQGDRFFWSGNGSLEVATKNLRRSLARLGKIAGIHCHPHRFRDTFASRLLSTGADIRTVSKLLGHRSVRTTEKHYAHFVASHQDLLDAATARLGFGRMLSNVGVDQSLGDSQMGTTGPERNN